MNKKIKMIRCEFIESVPDILKNGVLYVSIPFATAFHRCACGCKEQVVTPIRPTDWSLTWDRDTVSLYPSIGNWNFPCQSHYWIKKNKVVWDRKWDSAEINSARKQNKKRKEKYFKKNES